MPLLVGPEPEGAHHRRYVLVEPLGHLVGGVAVVRRRQRHGDRLEELALPDILPAVVLEEILEVDGPALVVPSGA